MPDFAVRTSFNAVDKISPAFRKMGAEADKFGRRASGAFGRTSKAASFLSDTMKTLLPVFGVAMIANYANKAIDLASSLTEVQNVVDTTFGKGAEDINKWSKAAITQFGLSELQAKQFTGSLGAMMKSSGLANTEIVEMSKNMVGLAGDFASFYNLDTEAAFEKIRSGISGETEPLKQLGINMSVANMEAFALAQGLGKAWKNMTQAEQVQLRYNYLLSVSKDAQGDFNKTLATSYANQKRVLGVKFDQAMANMATAILPTLTSAFESVSQAMDGIDFKRVGEYIATISSLIPPLVTGFVAWKVATYAVIASQKIMLAIGWLEYLHMMWPVILKSVGATNALGLAQWALNAAMTANPIGILIAAFAGLVAAGVLVYRNWEKIVKFFQDKFGPILEWVSEKWAAVKGFFGATVETPSEGSATGGRSAPNQTQLQSQSIRMQGEININGAPKGSTASARTRGPGRVDMRLAGVNP